MAEGSQKDMFEVLERQGKTEQCPSSPPCSCSKPLPFESWQSSKVGRVSSSGKVGTPIHHRSAKKSIRRASRELQRVRRKKRRWRGAVRRCLHELNNQKPEREWVQRCRELVKISGSVREIYCWEGCVATLLNCKLDRGEALQLYTHGMHLWLTRFSHFISVLIVLHLHCQYANHECCVFCTLLNFSKL